MTRFLSTLRQVAISFCRNDRNPMNSNFKSLPPPPPQVVKITSFVVTLVFFSLPLFAIEENFSQPLYTLPEVLVSGAPNASITVEDFYDKQQELSQRAGAVEVINSDSYKTGRSSTVKDALDFAPGVYVQPRFGQEESRLSIRGSGLDRGICGGEGIQILQDGMPINQADGSFQMQTIEPLATRYMEVYRGANSLQYGSTTLGGAINFVSFTGYNASPFTARFEYGSFNTFRGQISSGFSLGNYDYYTSLTSGSTDGYRNHSNQSNVRVFSNIGDKLSQNLETRFYVTYVDTLSQLPGPLTKSAMESDPTQAYPINSLNNWQKNYTFLRLGNKTTWDANENCIELQTFWDNMNLDDAMSVLNANLINDLGSSLQWKNKTALADHANNFTVGFNPTYGFTRDLQYTNNVGKPGGESANNEQYALNLNLFAQDQLHLTDKLSAVAGSAITYARRQNVDAWSSFSSSTSVPEMNMMMENMAGMRGMSGMKHRKHRNMDDMPGMKGMTMSSKSTSSMPMMSCCSSVSTNAYDNSGTESYWGWSPQVGMLYDITKTSQAFANVSRSFAPPSFSELVNQNYVGIMPLKAQTATTLETGTRGSEGRYRWDLAYYYSWVENEFFPYSVMTQTGPSTSTVNAGKTIHQGVEMGFDVVLREGIFKQPQLLSSTRKISTKDFSENGCDRIYFKQVGLFNDFHFSNDPNYGNNPLPGIPMLYYRAELLYEHPCGFYAGPNVEWVPLGYNVDAAATLYTDPYAILGFKIGYRPKHGFSVYLQVMNICNTTYATTTGIIGNAQTPGANLAQFFPGDGTAVYGGVEFMW